MMPLTGYLLALPPVWYKIVLTNCVKMSFCVIFVGAEHSEKVFECFFVARMTMTTVRVIK